MATTSPPATSTGTTHATPGRPDLGTPAPVRPRIRIPQLGVGLLLVAGAALAFVLWHAASLDRVAVLALADDVERGDIVTRADLREVHVGTDDQIATTPATAVDGVIGQVAVTFMAAGTLVVDGQFVDGATLVPGRGVVGLALSPGQYPTPRLRVGDLVNVLEVSAGPTLLVEAAEVVDVEVVGTQGQRFVSVLAGEELAGEVAAAAATGEVRLVQVARDDREEPS